MRYPSAITMLILALAIMPPANAQRFKPDIGAGVTAAAKEDYALVLRHFRPFARSGVAYAQEF